MDSHPQHKAHWVPVDFEMARLEQGEKPGSLTLKVTGMTPSGSDLGCPVKLEPVAYEQRPEYWRIDVLWNDTDAIFQSECPFDAILPVDTVRGSKGVEVVGKRRSVNLSFSTLHPGEVDEHQV